jgi:hypothetical protein
LSDADPPALRSLKKLIRFAVDALERPKVAVAGQSGNRRLSDRFAQLLSGSVRGAARVLPDSIGARESGGWPRSIPGAARAARPRTAPDLHATARSCTGYQLADLREHEARRVHVQKIGVSW